MERRKELGIPYEPENGEIEPLPEFGSKDFFVLSLGGNDLVLRKNFDPQKIMSQVSLVL